MKAIRFLTICTLLFFLLAVRAATAQSVPDAAPGDPLVSLTFRGGTVADYVAALSRQADDANILVMPDARPVKVPAVELTSVSLSAALRVLDQIVEEGPGRSVRLDYHWAFAEGTQNGRPIHTVGARVSGRLRGEAAARNMVLAVDYILASGVTPEAMLTAIETAVELLADEHEPARVRFPPEGEDDRLAWLLAVLEAMDDAEQRLLVDRYGFGRTLRSIGESVGLSPGAVDGRIGRLLRTLRRRAREEFHET